MHDLVVAAVIQHHHIRHRSCCCVPPQQQPPRGHAPRGSRPPPAPNSPPRAQSAPRGHAARAAAPTGVARAALPSAPTRPPGACPAARVWRPCSQRVHAGVRAHSFFSGGPAIAAAASASFVRVLVCARRVFVFGSVFPGPHGAKAKAKAGNENQNEAGCACARKGTVQKMRTQKKNCGGELHAGHRPISVVHEIHVHARHASSTTLRRGWADGPASRSCQQTVQQ